MKRSQRRSMCNFPATPRLRTHLSKHSSDADDAESRTLGGNGEQRERRQTYSAQDVHIYVDRIVRVLPLRCATLPPKSETARRDVARAFRSASRALSRALISTLERWLAAGCFAGG